jgi:hypothetical protein
VCKTAISSNHIEKCTEVVTELLYNTEILCTKCYQSVPLKEVVQHDEGVCAGTAELPRHTAHSVTLPPQSPLLPPGGEGASAGPSFEDHVSLLEERQALQEKCEEEKVALHTLEGLVTWCTLHLQNAESNPQLSVLLQETDKKRREISTMEKQISDVTGRLQRNFAKEDGPFVRALDSALESFNVSRQAYYGGTFIGNHVHRCLEVYRHFTQCVAE